MALRAKRYTATLSSRSIKNLIGELEAYKASIPDKCEEFVKRLAETGVPVIDSRYTSGMGDSSPEHYTYITVNSFGDYSQAKLICEGKDILFIEFGAGIHYNTPAGTSPNPYGYKFGYTIGSYGKGQGAKDSWFYYDESGAKRMSQGTLATKPMYYAVEEIIEKMRDIARDVFG